MTASCQLLLHLQDRSGPASGHRARHSRPLSDGMASIKLDKLLTGSKRIRIHPQRADKTLQSSTDRLVVVDNSDQWFSFRDNPLTQSRVGNKNTITAVQL